MMTTTSAPAANRNALPWQTLAAGGAIGSSLGGALGQQYQNAYNASLGMNAALFDRVQTGYDDLRSQVADQYGDILAGYQTHYGDVLGRIAGSNETNINDINTQYAANAGQSLQSAVSRGLGNSTVQQNMQRGIELDRARAVTDSQNRFAQLGANYANQIGLTRLGAQQQGVQMGAGLGQSQLGALERVNIPYPDIGMYAQMAQMQGANAARDAAGNRVPLAHAAIQASPGVSRPPSPFGSRDPTGGAYSTGNLAQPGGGMYSPGGGYSYSPNSFFSGGGGAGGGGAYGGSAGGFFGGGYGGYGGGLMSNDQLDGLIGVDDSWWYGGGLATDDQFNDLIGVDDSWWYDTDVNQGYGEDSGYYDSGWGDSDWAGVWDDVYSSGQDGAYDPVYDAWDTYADPGYGTGGWSGDDFYEGDFSEFF